MLEEKGIKKSKVKKADKQAEKIKDKELKDTKVDKQAEEIKELKDKLIRTQAEFENYKKRSKLELEEMAKYGTQKLILPLISVIDNFERALAIKSDENSKDKYYAGVEMIHKQFMEILCANGLEKIEAAGNDFDPSFHQGVMNENVEDDELVNKVTDELQKGYMLNKKVIRPTMVKIGTKG